MARTEHARTTAAGRCAARVHGSAIAAVLLAMLPACGTGEPEQPREPEPPAPGVVLEVDGLRVTRDEIEAYTEYFDEVDPQETVLSARIVY